LSIKEFTQGKNLSLVDFKIAKKHLMQLEIEMTMKIATEKLGMQ
jgi:hypothetical protein